MGQTRIGEEVDQIKRCANREIGGCRCSEGRGEERGNNKKTHDKDKNEDRKTARKRGKITGQRSEYRLIQVGKKEAEHTMGRSKSLKTKKRTKRYWSRRLGEVGIAQKNIGKRVHIIK